MGGGSGEAGKLLGEFWLSKVPVIVLRGVKTQLKLTTSKVSGVWKKGKMEKKVVIKGSRARRYYAVSLCGGVGGVGLKITTMGEKKRRMKIDCDSDKN